MLCIALAAKPSNPPYLEEIEDEFSRLAFMGD